MPGLIKERSSLDWLWLIRAFPVKISEIFILGGEPAQFVGLTALIHHTLKEKINITVFTNLMDDRFKHIPCNSRLRIIATFHGYHKDKFLQNLDAIKNNQIIVKELGTRKIFTKHKHVLIPKHKLKDIDRPWNGLAVGPDHKIFATYRDYWEHYEKIN